MLLNRSTFFFRRYSCSRSKSGPCLWTHYFHTYPEILERTRSKRAYINNYRTYHGKLIGFSTSVPVLLHDVLNTLKGTQLFPYSDKSRCVYNGLVYDKSCSE